MPSIGDPSPFDLARPRSVLRRLAKALLRTDLTSSLASPFPADLPENSGLDLFAATRATATAAELSVTAVAMHKYERTEFERGNRLEGFIDKAPSLIRRLFPLVRKSQAFSFGNLCGADGARAGAGLRGREERRAGGQGRRGVCAAALPGFCG